MGQDTLLGQTEIEWKQVQAAIDAPGVPQDVTVTFMDADNDSVGLCN